MYLPKQKNANKTTSPKKKIIISTKKNNVWHLMGETYQDYGSKTCVYVVFTYWLCWVQFLRHNCLFNYMGVIFEDANLVCSHILIYNRLRLLSDHRLQWSGSGSSNHSVWRYIIMRRTISQPYFWPQLWNTCFQIIVCLPILKGQGKLFKKGCTKTMYILTFLWISCEFIKSWKLFNTWKPLLLTNCL